MAKASVRHYRIKNWDQFQQYKDRNPKWVKLHYETLSSSDWVNADDQTRVLMVVCMLVGSRHGGQIPDDPDYLKRVGYLNFHPTFDQLLKLGFLIRPKYLRHKEIPVRNDTQETESERESEKKESLVGSAAPMPTRIRYSDGFEAFWKAYPTDKLMSKKLAFTQWQRLSDEDRQLAVKAVPAFRDHCRMNPDYRPVHAERFLSQRRFDGFAAVESTGSVIDLSDKLRRMQAENEARMRDVPGTADQSTEPLCRDVEGSLPPLAGVV